MKRKIKKFSGEEGSVVRTRSDKEFEEDSKYNGYGRYMPKTEEYTFDQVKDKLSGLFGGKKEDTSKFDELESVKKTKTLAEQIGRKAEPKADAGETSGKGLPGNKTKEMSVVDKKDAPYEVEKAEPKTGGGSGSSNRSSSSTKTGSGASKTAESKYEYPKNARPLKPITNEEKAAIKKRSEQDDADQESLRKQLEKNIADNKAAADQLKKNKSVAFKQNDSTDKIIDKTVKDTSGAKTVYSDKPFSFTKNLQDKKDKEKKDEDSKVSGPGGARAAEKNVRDFKGPFKDDETYKRMKEANKASLRSIETENQRTFKERAEAAKAEADKAEKKAEKKAAKEDKPAPKKESKSFAANKAKSGSTAGKMPGPKMDPYSMTLGSDLDPKRMMRDRKSSGEKDMKKGGQVKSSSASSRADGIAMRGKTRGRIY